MKKFFALLCIGFVFFAWINMESRGQGAYPVDVSAHFEDGERLPDVENRLIFLAGEAGHPARSGSLMLIDALVTIDRVFPLDNPPRVAVNLNISIQVKDAERGDVCGTMSAKASGGGVNEREAVFSGIQRIIVDKNAFADMLSRCSDFYNQIQEKREEASRIYFEEAQKARDSGKYQEALRKLRMVYPGTRVFEAAQQMIRDIRRMMPKPVVAILKFTTNSSAVADNFRDLLTTVLVREGIKVLEREQLQEILGEQRMELDGLVDPATVGEYGRLTGANFLVLGRLTTSGDEIEVNARLVKVKSSEILSVFQTKTLKENLENVARDIASEIWYDMENPPEPDPDDPKIVVDGKKMPRIMIMIPEEHIHRPIPDPAGETEMIRKFVNSGFRVVDQATVSNIRDTREGKAAAKGDVNAAAAIARQHGAEVIITGEAFSENVPRPGSQLQTCSARVEARAIVRDTGSILAANGKEAHATDATEFVAGKRALRTAGGLLADDMIKSILKSWERQIGSSQIEIIVRNIEFGQAVSFQRFLEDQENVINVQRRSFEDGVAIIDVESEKGAQDLADVLALTQLEGFSIKIEAVRANTIEISCK